MTSMARSTAYGGIIALDHHDNHKDIGTLYLWFSSSCS